MDENTNTYSSFEDMRKSYDSITSDNEKEDKNDDNESLLEMNEPPKIEERNDWMMLMCICAVSIGIVVILAILGTVLYIKMKLKKDILFYKIENNVLCWLVSRHVFNTSYKTQNKPCNRSGTRILHIRHSFSQEIV